MTIGLSRVIVSPPSLPTPLPPAPHPGDQVSSSKSQRRPSSHPTPHSADRIPQMRSPKLRWLTPSEFQDFSDTYLAGLEAGYHAAQALFEQGQTVPLRHHSEPYTAGHYDGWSRYLQAHLH